ncbi:MAG: outer membrane beta-barrel protein [Hyphomonadaceae bacterium]|jgi:outer membrane immunogenic protein|nr:outer membrane beta-barrel protein [Hyphomonadaceae bacterium]
MRKAELVFAPAVAAAMLVRRCLLVVGRTCAAAVAVASFAGSALAGGEITGMTSVRPFSWTGFYIGGQIGYGRGESDWTTPLTNYAFSWDSRGFFGGGHIGYNRRWDAIVVGLQAEINGTNIDGNGFDPRFGGFTFTDDVRWFGSVDARIGVLAHPGTLIYLIGGYAFADIRHTIGGPSPAISAPVARFSETYSGWDFGGGVEHAFSPHMTARIEYRYYDFGDASFPQTGGVFPHTHEFTMQTVRAGLSYKF